MKTQRDVVFEEVQSVLGTTAATIQVAQVTKELKKTIKNNLVAKHAAGVLVIKKQMDEAKVRSYCSGLLNDCLNKDERFTE